MEKSNSSLENNHESDDEEELVEPITMPEVVYKEFISTKSIKEVKTPICDVKISV